MTMLNRFRFVLAAAALSALGACATTAPDMTMNAQPMTQHYLAQGLVRVQSRFGFDETVARIRADVAAKGIREFAVVAQSALAHDAGIELRPSTLIIFGNPPLGTQFITSNPNSGLDWPVRVLVYQDEAGVVWAAYNDFHYLEHRHRIGDRQAAFAMADHVIQSILDSVRAPA
jgi:uncharacterized protein (DUF302 family)